MGIPLSNFRPTVKLIKKQTNQRKCKKEKNYEFSEKYLDG